MGRPVVGLGRWGEGGELLAEVLGDGGELGFELADGGVGAEVAGGDGGDKEEGVEGLGLGWGEREGDHGVRPR